MKQSYFARLLNIFWGTLLFVLVFFALARYYLSAKWALVLACGLAVVAELILIKLKNRKLNKLGIKNKELDHAQKVIKALYLAPDNAVDLLFLQAVQRSVPEAKLESGWIITPNMTCACFFNNKTTSAKEVVNKLASCPKTDKQKVAFGIGFEQEAASLNIKLLDSISTYAFLKNQKIFPKTENIILQKKKLLKNAINRKNAFRYIFLTIIFSISGFFVPQTRLYLIFTIITAILATLCLFSKKQTEELFLIN